MAQQDSKPIAIRMEGVSKQYRLGELNAQTFKEAWLQWWKAHGVKRASAPDLPARLGEPFYALRDLDLTVRQGEVLGIIGHNGAGKSTMLKLISRITAPSAGTIQLRGRVASLLEVGCGFHPDMTGRENIYLNGAILGMRKTEIDRKLADIADFSEVGEFLDTPVKRYSSGMYVKLAFAVAAHLDSEILIMDEVLAVGDVPFQKKCLQKMRETASDSGRTILYVSHNMSTIRSLCDRCIVLDHGKKIYDGEVEHAIAVYLGTGSADRLSYRYDASCRPYDQLLRPRPRLEMEMLRLLDERMAFPADQLQRLELRCRAMEPLMRVGFRFELWYEDGAKLCSVISRDLVDLREGENRLELVFDPAHLCAGQYSADLVAYQRDEHDNETILDGVYPGWLFQIISQDEEGSPAVWDHRYWGHIRLHDLGVEHVE